MQTRTVGDPASSLLPFLPRATLNSKIGEKGPQLTSPKDIRLSGQGGSGGVDITYPEHDTWAGLEGGKPQVG